MADKDLMDKIRKYVESTNNLGRPTTEEEQELFSKIMNKDKVFNHTALDLSELRQFANEVKATEVKTCLSFYTEVAKELGIRCIDTESNTDGEIIIETNLEDEQPDAEDGQPDAEDEQPDEEDEQPDAEDETEEVQWGMKSDIQMMPIPKIGISNETIKDIGDISNESANKLVEAINGLRRDKEKETEANKEFKVDDSSESYTEEDRNNDVIGIPYSKVKNAVQRGMNVIYRGVPGCGKTYTAKCDAKVLVGFRKSNRIKQIDFTENLDYSDTMVGLRQSENGRWQYIKGEIAKFCEFAAEFKDEKFVLILNEFTRANTEAVLGQMFTAMENKYRGDEFILDNGEKFMCPKNLIVLATMNGTDKGVKKLDKATEERFYIIDVKPLWEEWAKVKKDEDNEAFFELVIMLNIKLDSEEYTILKEMCIEMANINKDCEAGGLLTSDSQIGQRQLLQFIGQTDLDDNKIKYDKETLGIIIEQLISRVIPMKDMYSTVEDSVNKLRKLLERCNG